MSVRKWFDLVHNTREDGVGCEMGVTSFCQARPAVTSVHEANVEDKKNGKQVVYYGDSYRCTGETPIELLRRSDTALTEARRRTRSTVDTGA